MKLCALCLLMISSLCLQRAACSLPSFTPASPQLQVGVLVDLDSDMDPSVRTRQLRRLPGLCRRLKRRRVTMLVKITPGQCNKEKFCWRGQSQKARSGQVCLCPRGSRCSRFFIHSL